MARYRSIQTSFWQDNFIVKLPLIEKGFYSYILTNSRTNQCGIYNFSITFSAIELGCSEDEIRTLLDKFVQYGKILYDAENQELMILNWYKYNLNNSKNTLTCVNRELEDVKNKEFVRKFYELCKLKRYPLEIIFDGIDIDQPEGKGPEKKADCLGNKETTVAQVVKHFSSNIHMITPVELEDLKDWCDKLNEDIVIMAIDEAVRNNARNIKYINGILINWHAEGLQKVQDVKLFMKDWKDKVSKKSKEKGENNAGAYKVVAEVGANGEG
jgi:DnaD/phage-associated family protein